MVKHILSLFTFWNFNPYTIKPCEILNNKITLIRQTNIKYFT